VFDWLHVFLNRSAVSDCHGRISVAVQWTDAMDAEFLFHIIPDSRLKTSQYKNTAGNSLLKNHPMVPHKNQDIS
jgi:hypothetical protein